MIFQEPMTSLNPVLKIGLQITEPLTIHLGMDDATARARAIELLTLVGITDPESRLNQYPHQLSGGMRQRVMIAIGLACNPKLLIADEPTTALDVTIQAQILELMKDLSRRLGVAVVIITHNLGIVARYADRVNVMYAARLVESGTAERVFGRPLHPYARGLLAAVPRLDRGRTAKLATIDGAPPNLLDPPVGLPLPPALPLRHREVPGRSRRWRRSSRAPRRLPSRGRDRGARSAGRARPRPPARRASTGHDDDSHPRHQGRQEVLPRARGLPAQAQAGARRQRRHHRHQARRDAGPGRRIGLREIHARPPGAAARRPDRRRDPFEGVDLARLDRGGMIAVRKKMQVIFQDPYSSLNPRMTVGQIIAEPIRVHGILPKPQIPERVAELLQVVGLFPYMALRYPHELSGGQRQRVGIARALAVDPRVIVCDEAVSALDVSIQGQVINLLEDLQQRLGLTYLFIAHDLAVVRHISSKVAVMYLGRIVEYAPADELFANPKHPYTRALLAAAPVPDPVIERTPAAHHHQGRAAEPAQSAPGCVFHPRCPLATEECRRPCRPSASLRRGIRWPASTCEGRAACLHHGLARSVGNRGGATLAASPASGAQRHALVHHPPPGHGDPDADRRRHRRVLPHPRDAGRRRGGEAQGRRRRHLRGDDPGRAQAPGARQAALRAVRRLHGRPDAASTSASRCGRASPS